MHTQIREEVSFTKGRIIVRGKLHTRGEQKRADYSLYFKSNIPLAVIEAKKNGHSVGSDMQQALNYAETFGVPFVFSSNGDAFLMHDRTGLADKTELELELALRQSELSRYQLLKDDLLVTEGRDWDKVGRTAIWNAEIENCIHQNHILRMRGIIKGISSSWVEMYMNSIAKAYFQAASMQTTNLASINMTQLKNCLLAFPTFQEQYHIVAKVNELMAICGQLKSRLIEASQLQQKLADVVVEQAVN